MKKTRASMLVGVILLLVLGIGAPASSFHGPNNCVTIIGTDAGQEFIGTAYCDHMHMRGGYDGAWGEGDKDGLQGDNGNDGLYGKGDNDTLEGGPGGDYLNGGAGDDICRTGDNPGDHKVDC